MTAMKNFFLAFALLIGATLSAQTEKGASPLQSQIPNPKSQIRNPKSEIRNPKSEIRNPKSPQDDKIPDLRFADRDAEAFAGWLRSPSGGSLAADQIMLLTNGQAKGRQPGLRLHLAEGRAKVAGMAGTGV